MNVSDLDKEKYSLENDKDCASIWANKKSESAGEDGMHSLRFASIRTDPLWMNREDNWNGNGGIFIYLFLF